MEIIYKNKKLSLPALPIASSEQLGAIKVGSNLSISEDGVLSASAGEASSSIAAGNGIKVEHSDETNVDTVSIADATLSEIAKVDGLETAVSDKVSKSGDTMTGQLTISGHDIVINGGSVVITSHAGTGRLRLNPSGKISVSGNDPDSLGFITGLGAPTTNRDAANKLYVDDLITAQSIRITGLQDTVNDTKTGVESLTTEVNGVKTQVEAVENRANKNSADIGDLRTDLTAAKELAEAAKEAAENASTSANDRVLRAGDTMTGQLTVPNVTVGTLHVEGISNNTVGNEMVLTKEGGDGTELFRIQNVGSPNQEHSAVNKIYVDNLVKSVGGEYLPVKNPTARGTLTIETINPTTEEESGAPAELIIHNYEEYGEEPILSLGAASIGGVSITSGISEEAAPEGGEESGGEGETVTPEGGGVESGGGLVRNGRAGTVGVVILTGVKTPVRQSDAANKAYVDAYVGDIQTALDRILN